MAQYATLKAAIDAVIKANGQREITGTVLNQTLNAMVNSLGANYQLAGVATPSTNPGTPDQNVFYLAFKAGTYTNFNATVLSAGISIFMWNGSWSSQTFYTIDATPTASSNNLVSSGAVFDAIKTDGSAYDVSAHFPTAGPNSDGKFTLEYILSNANTLIPAAWRKGGMSIKFVQSSDNKYVQYFLTATEFTTAVAYWQKKETEVKGDLKDNDFAIADENHNAIVKFSSGHIQTKNFDSSVDANEEGRGLMSASDKIKLNGIESGSEVNNTKTINTFDDDFDIQDGNGHAVVAFGSGHIKTKNFNSEDVDGIISGKKEVKDADYVIMDEEKNAVVIFGNGHIKTKNFNSEEVHLDTIDDMGLALNGNYNGCHLITVGDGNDYDFSTIQDAINSVTDARVDNQYIILVCKDFYVNDITELTLKSDRTQHVTSVTDLDQGKECAYIYTKDWVHIMGKGMREIYVDFPADVVTASRIQYVHNIYHKGSCRLENLKIVSHGCRYCIHSEGGSASTTSPDYCAVKEFVNLNCIYIGDSGESPRGYAQAYGVGTANGLKLHVKGCKFIGQNGAKSGYSHTHPNYDFPSTTFIEDSVFDEEGVDGNFYLGNLFSGQNNRLIVNSSSFKHLSLQDGISLTVNAYTDFDLRHNLTKIEGHANRIRMDIRRVSSLRVDASNNGEDIVSIEGSALGAVFGAFLKKYVASTNSKARWIGSLYHGYSSTNNLKQNFSSLGYCLGDCSSTNKTLIIIVGEHTETITFDKNYGGLSGTTPVANYSDSDIIAEMNAQLQYCEIKSGAILGRLYFDDEVELVYNNSDEPIYHDSFLAKDTTQQFYMNAVKLCRENEEIYGVSAERINPHSYGYMLKRGKQRLWRCLDNGFNLSNIAGKYYKAGNDGRVIETMNKSEACLYGSDAVTLDWI